MSSSSRDDVARIPAPSISPNCIRDTVHATKLMPENSTPIVVALHIHHEPRGPSVWQFREHGPPALDEAKYPSIQRSSGKISLD